MVEGLSAAECQTVAKIASLALVEYRRLGCDRWPAGVQALVDRIAAQAERHGSASPLSVSASDGGRSEVDRETIVFVGTGAAAERRQVSESWVRYLATNGRIPGAFQRAPGSPWRIPESWVEEVCE